MVGITGGAADACLTCQEAKLTLADWTSTRQAPKVRPLPSKMVIKGRPPQVSCKSSKGCLPCVLRMVRQRSQSEPHQHCRVEQGAGCVHSPQRAPHKRGAWLLLAPRILVHPAGQ